MKFSVGLVNLTFVGKVEGIDAKKLLKDYELNAVKIVDVSEMAANKASRWNVDKIRVKEFSLKIP